jgi:ACT domain-containing protein
MHEAAEPLARENVLITVVGQDRVGIIARVATSLAQNNINILDLNQKIMQGYFVMNLMADMAGSKIDLDALNRLMDDVGREMGLKIMVQHENIFRSMHRI